ncbi:MAG: membrane protein insertion efficiency factor YidD [Planctomycetota bacterium]|nr:membrane protein insertion efficiency factor YidD [Planctomycetota bacterium]
MRLPRLLLLIWRLPGLILKGMVRFYQLAVSPFLGRNCRFHPSCSSYMIQAIDKYGAVKGTLKGVGRILRCHPWNPGGEDYP